MRCSSNHCKTPMCAKPSAPPPSSATPIFGRGRRSEVSSIEDGVASWARVASGAHNRWTDSKREAYRQRPVIGTPQDLERAAAFILTATIGKTNQLGDGGGMATLRLVVMVEKKMGLDTLHHAALRVRDVQEAVDWYRQR